MTKTIWRALAVALPLAAMTGIAAAEETKPSESWMGQSETEREKDAVEGVGAKTSQDPISDAENAVRDAPDDAQSAEASDLEDEVEEVNKARDGNVERMIQAE